MPAEWLPVIGPIASKIFEKLVNGQKTTAQEQQIVLLYEIANTTKEIKELRGDISEMCASIRDMGKAITDVRVDTTYIRAKLESNPRRAPALPGSP